jgi:putative ABC transport system substrate-binding protein
MMPKAAKSDVDRRYFLLTSLAAGVLAVPLAAAAQRPRSPARLGLLTSSTAERDKERLEALYQGLHDLGWIDGRNITITRRLAGGRFDRLPALAAELVRLNPDVLVVAGAPAAQAAKNATRTIPIVMTNAADPVGTGLVASLARPGGNVTGLSDFNAGVVVKRLEILKEIVPTASRVAALLNPTNPTNPLQFKLIQEAAPALRVSLSSLEARNPEDIDGAFARMRTDATEALVIMGDPMLGSQLRRMSDLSLRIRLPSTYAAREWSEGGGLVSYGPSFEDLFRRAATYVDKILKGAQPADLPVEQPTKFDLVINLKTAKALGLTIPPSLLLRSDQIIE